MDMKQIKNKSSRMSKIRSFLISNMVTILFIVICYFGFKFSGLTFDFYLRDILRRVARNAFLIMALILPVLAGMGLNFAIVIGAMAGQAALLIVTLLKINGIAGFFAAIAISTPFAILFGWLLGLLLNKTRGQEMITSLVLSLFANGIYLVIFLILVGRVIPWPDPGMLLNRGFGIRNTIDLGGVRPGEGIKGALDNLISWPLYQALIVFGVLAIVYLIGKQVYNKVRKGQDFQLKAIFSKENGSTLFWGIVSLAVGIFLMMSDLSYRAINVPVATFMVIGLLWMFNVFIVKTKIGQDFRATGMDMHVAAVAGINVQKTRVKAIIYSIVIASWGQIIFLQNLGNLNTYGSHSQVGMFAIAAILIGGASVSRATNGQAILGAILFHTLFIVSPMAGKNLFGDAQIGEYFRAFVAYGVIAVALVMHSLRQRLQRK